MTNMAKDHKINELLEELYNQDEHNLHDYFIRNINYIFMCEKSSIINFLSEKNRMY